MVSLCGASCTDVACHQYSETWRAWRAMCHASLYASLVLLCLPIILCL